VESGENGGIKLLFLFQHRLTNAILDTLSNLSLKHEVSPVPYAASVAPQYSVYYSEKSVCLVLPILYFSFVIYELYRQVLIPVDNSHLLLKLEILDKLKLVTFHTTATQRKCNITTGSYYFRRNESSHDFDSPRVELKMLVT
jgi:hypothetical protein